MAGTFGLGSTFKLGTTTITELTSISGPNFSADDIDVTTHANTNTFKSFIKGLTDAGEITIEGNMIYTDYNTVYASAITTSLYSATITIPTSPSVTQWVANVYCKGFEIEMPFDDKVSFTGTFKIDGRPTMSRI
jgi:uncharacterized glyoxalase superfamily protein PhnB